MLYSPNGHSKDSRSDNHLCALVIEPLDSLDANDQTSSQKSWELLRSNAIIEKLTHEGAIPKLHKYAQRVEHQNAPRPKLQDELIDTDLSAIETELDQAMPEEHKAARPVQKPKCTPMPSELSQILIHQNPHCRSRCQLKPIGEDVSEKLENILGEAVFFSPSLSHSRKWWHAW